MPMQVGELGRSPSLDGAGPQAGELGNIDTYTLDRACQATTSAFDGRLDGGGTAEAKETHRRFTIAFYCSAVFKRIYR